jgi:hypothetical protein
VRQNISEATTEAAHLKYLVSERFQYPEEIAILEDY